MPVTVLSHRIVLEDGNNQSENDGKLKIESAYRIRIQNLQKSI